MAISKVSTGSYQEWKDLRGKYIGGSDAASVVGLNPYCSRYSLWAQKTGKVEGFSGNLATEVGTYLEDFVAKKFAVMTGKKVRNCMQSWLNDEYPWAIANIDREVVGEDAGLEIKTTDSLNLKKFKNGEYPANYYCQMVHYLAITGKQKWYLAVLIGNRDFKIFELERDQEEIDSLMQAEKEFWTEFVEKDTAPAVDGYQSTADTINEIYDTYDDESISLIGYEHELERYSSLGKEIKQLKAEQDAIGNQIKELIGNANAHTGTVGRFKATWKSQSRTTFDYKRYAADHPWLDLTDYCKNSESRVFRLTEKKE